MARANLFNIPPGAPFLPTFVDRFLSGEIISGIAVDDPLGLGETIIYTPTRRAGRALASELSRRLRGCALLPRIVPLGALDQFEPELVSDFHHDASFDAADDPALPPAMDEIERRLILSRLILGWGRSLRRSAAGEPRADESLLVAATPGQAWSLARDLANLIDEFVIEGAPWSALDKLVPDEFDRYWALTLDFLKIARENWPVILASRGMMEGVARRASLAERIAELIVDGAARSPIIAVGSTGTNSTTALLLAAIARAPRGAVVLPGLDQRLDARSWSLIGATQWDGSAAGHPQAALRRLLSNFGVAREEVRILGAAPPEIDDRAVFLSEALIPAEATESWPQFDRAIARRALAAIDLIEASDEREEALALAVRLREALETPGLTAALITPDRSIAARVRSELRRWDIAAEDSAGEPLASTPAGVFAILVLRAAAEAELGIEKLALLAHPMTLLGFARERTRDLAGLAEIAVARRFEAKPLDLDARLRAARADCEGGRGHPALRSVNERDWRELEALLTSLAQAVSELRELSQGANLAAWVRAHRKSMATIAPLIEDEGLDLIADTLERLAAAANDDPTILDERDYRELFEALIREIAVHAGAEGHPRIKILGLLEARLMTMDLVLLAGLDETIWPPAAANDPFLNRPMREALGLSSPERRIGQTAHDFVQAMAAPRVAISRAKKRGGSPTTPSRFLQRMQALAGAELWLECRRRGSNWLALAETIERPAPVAPLPAPRPKPALALRPKRLSVTRIEVLRRDPYSIFAESILRLAPLPPLQEPEAARAAGEELHALLADFVRAHPAGPPPPDAARSLREEALARFATLLEDADWRCFHWPRLERALAAFIDWEGARRGDVESIFVEQRGELRLDLADGSEFVLSAVADRLEKGRDGGWKIIDYKSGRAPSPLEIACGFSPQLTLEAAMLERGAFACAPTAANAAEAFYLRLAKGEACSAPTVKGRDSAAFRRLIADHYEGAISLLSQFRDEATPYLSRPYPQFARRFGVYDHLARVKEWSLAGAEGEPGA